MTRVGVITQARMTSTRLPGKVLLPADGVPMLGHHLRRLSGLGVPVIVATTVNAADDALVDLSHAHGALVFRGSEQDVLSRFADAATSHRLDVVVRVTSDCPLIDPAVIQRGVDRYLELDDEDAHVSNVIERSFPRGFDFEVFSTAALVDAERHATEPSDREHVTPYLYSGRSGRSRLHAITRPDDASHLRVTLDTDDDLRVLRALIEEHGAASLTADEIISVLEMHPDLAEMNAHVEQKKLGE